MESLTVEREWITSYRQTTILKTKEGRVVEIIREHTKQPKKGTPTITLTKLGKQKTYLLNWSKVN
jgi:hypothetical protein